MISVHRASDEGLFFSKRLRLCLERLSKKFLGNFFDSKTSFIRRTKHRLIKKLITLMDRKSRDGSIKLINISLEIV